jgi:hypothetical protein
VNTLPPSNRLAISVDLFGKQGEDRQQGEDRALPEFLLSPMPPCVVELVPDATQQTQPSKTRAELLADGQCEV